MQKRTRVMITFGGIIILIAFLYIFTNWFSVVTGYLKGEDDSVKLANCLGEKNAEFYGNEFCVECEKQRTDFRNSLSSINYVDCGRDKQNCPNIKEIPAWYISGKIYYGYKNSSELKQISGC